MRWNEHILQFFENLSVQVPAGTGVEVLYPFSNAGVMDLCRAFYNKFYNDAAPRHVLTGINPGRFGGGVTGIPFTDPIRLQQDCGIVNDAPKRQELSSVFMYEMIAAFGGPAAFYKQFYITSVSPLGFVQKGKNLNYYDDKPLKQAIKPFVISCMQQQLDFGIQRDVCFCIGEGGNLKFLQQLNAEQGWFNTIVPLPHPRFVMQYKLKQKADYVALYVERLSKHL